MTTNRQKAARSDTPAQTSTGKKIEDSEMWFTSSVPDATGGSTDA